MSLQALTNGAEEATGNDAADELRDPKEALEHYDWEDLEERFQRKMEERQVVENDIYQEFNTLLAVCGREAL